MVTKPRRYHFDVDDYYKMAEARIFLEDDRVELIDGEIIQMTPIGPRHADVQADLAKQLAERLGARAQVRSQSSIRLGGEGEPLPDLVVVRHRPGQYRSRHPTAEDVLLVVEVADRSLRHDRQTKAALYAQHGHWRQLRAERFKVKRRVWVRPPWIGATEWEFAGQTYRVLTDRVGEGEIGVPGSVGDVPVRQQAPRRSARRVI